ncbi:MAG: GAF domain-containing protein [Methylotenera sp.]|nr:GAF domain-containing protein [Methylotenera sp.]
MESEQTKTKEQQRIKSLRKLQILDSPFEMVFHTITKVASEVCGTPISLISLIDEKRQWFKANVGLEGMLEMPREVAFCAYTIQADELMEVPDATQDERFWDNPLVTGNPDIRFYCGAPIKLPMGENIGSICVIDTKANYLNDAQRKTLEGLAQIISELLVAREVNIRARLSEQERDGSVNF